jgi:hypothetical protein
VLGKSGRTLREVKRVASQNSWFRVVLGSALTALSVIEGTVASGSPQVGRGAPEEQSPYFFCPNPASRARVDMWKKLPERRKAFGGQQAAQVGGESDQKSTWHPATGVLCVAVGSEVRISRYSFSRRSIGTGRSESEQGGAKWEVRENQVFPKDITQMESSGRQGSLCGC